MSKNKWLLWHVQGLKADSHKAIINTASHKLSSLKVRAHKVFYRMVNQSWNRGWQLASQKLTKRATSSLFHIKTAKCLSSLNIKLSLHLIHFTMTGQTYFSSAWSWIILYSIHFSPLIWANTLWSLIDNLILKMSVCSTGLHSS